MEEIIAIGGFFSTVIIVSLGFPLVRSWTRQKEKEPPKILFQVEERLSRIETSIDSMAVEIERISESQRFVTKLMSDRERVKALPSDNP
jgi:hypothetical protein